MLPAGQEFLAMDEDSNRRIISAAISLVQGQIYYVEALHKEGTANDNLAVGWAKPGQSTSVPSEIIPGAVLSPFRVTLSKAEIEIHGIGVSAAIQRALHDSCREPKSAASRLWTRREWQLRCGASALGFVSAMPSGPGVISEETIAHIARRIPSPIATFLLTSAASSDAIVAQQDRCGTNTLQLCDYANTRLPRSSLRASRCRPRAGHPRYWLGGRRVARAAAEHVYALLLDSGDTTPAVELLGGTGRTHDETTGRRIRDTVGVRLLAGGLTATNVGEAVATVEPFGVDLCSGVRTDDRLDLAKLQGFFSALDESVER